MKPYLVITVLTGLFLVVYYQDNIWSLGSDDVTLRPEFEDPPSVKPEPEPSYPKYVEDSIIEYGIAKRHGSYMDACVHASFIANEVLLLHMEDKYAFWRDIERKECRKAGLGDW